MVLDADKCRDCGASLMQVGSERGRCSHCNDKRATIRLLAEAVAAAHYGDRTMLKWVAEWVIKRAKERENR